MTDFNDIGISRELDLPRIKKLLSIGLFASLLHFAGDMILGWGVEDETLDGIMRMVSAYTGTSDGGIFAAALLGLFGMVLEGLACFGIYRMIAPYSPKYAHSYRTGIFGYLIFGECGFHVPTCALAFLTKHVGSAIVMQPSLCNTPRSSSCPRLYCSGYSSPFLRSHRSRPSPRGRRRARNGAGCSPCRSVC